jgi:hypothetical protein
MAGVVLSTHGVLEPESAPLQRGAGPAAEAFYHCESTCAGGNHTAASVGIEIYDGQGNVTRSLVLNEREADHARKVVPITGQGTYRVQPNGMGTATIVNTQPDGSTFTSHLDFVITQATTAKTNGEKVATEVFAMLRETGVAASLVTFVLTRLPD